MKMHFAKATDYDNIEHLVKVYDHGDDWQVVSDLGERWYSKHSGIPEEGSLMIASGKYTSEFHLTCICWAVDGCSTNA